MPLGLLFSLVLTLPLSLQMPLFLPSSVSLFYFILAVSMCESLGKYSCISSSFPVAILNGTFFFLTTQLHMCKRHSRWDRFVGRWLCNFLLLLLLCTRIPFYLVPKTVYYTVYHVLCFISLFWQHWHNLHVPIWVLNPC